jgi:hypothetical protein
MRRTATILFATLIVAACDGENLFVNPGASTDISGIYHLVSVAGNPLPFTLEETGTSKLEILWQEATMRRDLTFSSRGEMRVTENGVETILSFTTQGTYERSGNTITGTTSTGNVFTMRLVGGRLIQTVEGRDWVYERR